jgi:sugar phosphate isomerase/epimerase
MQRPLIITGSALGNPPTRELVDAATAAGYDGLSLWPAAGYGNSADDRRIIDDAGLSVFDVDALVAWVGPDDPGPPYFEEAPPAEVWAAAEALGAQSVNALLVGPRGTSLDAASEAFAALADEAAQRGFKITIELARGTPVADLQAAAHMLTSIDRPNAGLMIDSWGFHWSKATAGDLRALPGAHVGGLQLSDAPAERPGDLMHATRYHREVPGTGVADLVGLLDAIDAIGSSAPVVLEVFNNELLDRHGVTGFAQVLADATRLVQARQSR